LNLSFRPSKGSGFRIVLILVVACLLHGSGLASPQASDAQAAFNEAVGLLQSGKSAEALAVIDSALDSGARDPSLYNLKGLAAGELGRDQEAEESFRAVIKLAPKAAMGYNNLGVLLSKLGRHQDAAAAFREAHSREPQNFNALLGLGTSLAALEKYDEAAKYLQRAWEVRPGDFQAGYEWAHALLEAKQPAAAKKVLNQLTVPQGSDSAVKYYSLAGVVAEGMNEFVPAAQFYRQAYTLNPDSYDLYLALVRASLSADASPGKEALPDPPEKLSASQHLALGLLFSSRDAFEQAIPRFEAALELQPTNEVSILNLALAEKSTGRSSAAIDRLRRAVASRPSAALYDALAAMEEESGHYVEAVQSYQRAVELDPTSEQYYFDLGVEYLSHFTFGPAAEVYRVGTQKFPSSSRQFIGLGFSHYSVREYREAADAFTTALEIDPDSPAVFRAWKSVLDSLAPNDWEKLLPRLDRLATAHPQSAELAFCYGAALFRSEFAKGQKAALDRSQALLEQSLRLRPDSPAAHLELGALYTAKKLNQKAVDQYLEVIREDPKSEVPHYRLGQIYREMNKLDSATAELTQYQELARLHQEELKRQRSTIQQFIIPQAGKPNN
jgi:tetratricopeptide (TPR) repeat protein